MILELVLYTYICLFALVHGIFGQLDIDNRIFDNYREGLFFSSNHLSPSDFHFWMLVMVLTLDDQLWTIMIVVVGFSILY